MGAGETLRPEAQGAPRGPGTRTHAATRVVSAGGGTPTHGDRAQSDRPPPPSRVGPGREGRCKPTVPAVSRTLLPRGPTPSLLPPFPHAPKLVRGVATNSGGGGPREGGVGGGWTRGAGRRRHRAPSEGSGVSAWVPPDASKGPETGGGGGDAGGRVPRAARARDGEARPARPPKPDAPPPPLRPLAHSRSPPALTDTLSGHGPHARCVSVAAPRPRPRLWVADARALAPAGVRGPGQREGHVSGHRAAAEGWAAGGGRREGGRSSATPRAAPYSVAEDPRSSAAAAAGALGASTWGSRGQRLFST